MSPPLPKQKKIPQKRENFFHFSKFLLQSLVTKNIFLSPKSDWTLQCKFRKIKKVLPVLGYFFLFGGGGIKKTIFSKLRKWFLVWGVVRSWNLSYSFYFGGIYWTKSYPALRSSGRLQPQPQPQRETATWQPQHRKWDQNVLENFS